MYLSLAGGAPVLNVLLINMPEVLVMLSPHVTQTIALSEPAHCI